jgi:hypothetical protein
MLFVGYYFHTYARNAIGIYIQLQAKRQKLRKFVELAVIPGAEKRSQRGYAWGKIGLGLKDAEAQKAFNNLKENYGPEKDDYVDMDFDIVYDEMCEICGLD